MKTLFLLQELAKKNLYNNSRWLIIIIMIIIRMFRILRKKIKINFNKNSNKEMDKTQIISKEIQITIKKITINSIK